MQLVNCYEKEVGAAPIMLLNTDFPSNKSMGVTMGQQMVASLIAWHKAGVMPLVVLDPTLNGSSVNMNLNAFKPGSVYYQALSNYFQTIRNAGITTDEMGVWVPFDEPNQPEWYRGIVSPSLFDSNVDNFAANIRAYYPNVNLSIMLDSQTCQTRSPCVTADDYQTYNTALKPYLNNLTAADLNSFGMEGFTWTSTDNASQYLNPEVTIDCADQLGLKSVWFNTGTYQVVDDNNVVTRVTVARRNRVLNSQIFGQMASVEGAGLKVDFVNMFSQNVLGGNWSANYSYDYSNPTTTTDALKDLKTFITKSNSLSTPIPVAIFDAIGN
jgi:hypothetical protein